MSASAESIKSKYSDFSDVENDLINEFLVMAENLVSADFWGNKYDSAHELMACHLMTMNSVGFGNTSNVKSETMGRMSVTYANPETSLDKLSATKYGSILELMRKSIRKTPFLY